MASTPARPLGSRYVLEEPVGRGAMGTVWRARVRDTGEPVAVKVLRQDLSAEPEVVTRFLQERNVLLRLSHPHLVQVRDLVAEADELAMVMELVEGHDLHVLLRKKRTLPPVEAVRIMAQIADALIVVHAAGVVHRDLKPANILMDETAPVPYARLTDFGIARLLDGPALTRLSGVVGTPGYLAPELAHGSAPTPAADVYAAGIVLYELIAGRTPYAGDTPVVILRRQIEDHPRSIEGIPYELWAIIERCLAKLPERRPTAEELVWLLRATTVELMELPALPPMPPDRPSPQRTRWNESAGRTAFDRPVAFPAPGPTPHGVGPGMPWQPASEPEDVPIRPQARSAESAESAVPGAPAAGGPVVPPARSGSGPQDGAVPDMDHTRRGAGGAATSAPGSAGHGGQARTPNFPWTPAPRDSFESDDSYLAADTVLRQPVKDSRPVPTPSGDTVSGPGDAGAAVVPVVPAGPRRPPRRVIWWGAVAATVTAVSGVLVAPVLLRDHRFRDDGSVGTVVPDDGDADPRSPSSPQPERRGGRLDVGKASSPTQQVVAPDEAPATVSRPHTPHRRTRPDTTIQTPPQEQEPAAQLGVNSSPSASISSAASPQSAAPETADVPAAPAERPDPAFQPEPAAES